MPTETENLSLEDSILKDINDLIAIGSIEIDVKIGKLTFKIRYLNDLQASLRDRWLETGSNIQLFFSRARATLCFAIRELNGKAVEKLYNIKTEFPNTPEGDISREVERASIVRQKLVNPFSEEVVTQLWNQGYNLLDARFAASLGEMSKNSSAIEQETANSK